MTWVVLFNVQKMRENSPKVPDKNKAAYQIFLVVLIKYSMETCIIIFLRSLTISPNISPSFSWVVVIPLFPLSNMKTIFSFFELHQPYIPLFLFVTGHRYVDYVQIMRWRNSNLGQWPLWNLGSVAYCYVFIIDPPCTLLPSSYVLLAGSAPSFPNTPSAKIRLVPAQDIKHIFSVNPIERWGCWSLCSSELMMRGRESGSYGRIRMLPYPEGFLLHFIWSLNCSFPCKIISPGLVLFFSFIWGPALVPCGAPIGDPTDLTPSYLSPEPPTPSICGRTEKCFALNTYHLYFRGGEGWLYVSAPPNDPLWCRQNSTSAYDPLTYFIIHMTGQFLIWWIYLCSHMSQ